MHNNTGKIILLSVSIIIPLPPILPIFLIPGIQNKPCSSSKETKLVVEFITDNKDEIFVNKEEIYFTNENDDIIKATNLILEIKEINEKYIKSNKNKQNSKPHSLRQDIYYNKENIGKSLTTATISFPVSCDKLNNYTLTINNIYDNNGKQIEIPKRKIHYDKSYILEFIY